MEAQGPTRRGDFRSWASRYRAEGGVPTSVNHGQRPPHEPVGGILDPRRLAAVERAELRGHLDDADLNAVVLTLRLACDAPVALVNIVTHDHQTFPAEAGLGLASADAADEDTFCARVVDGGQPVVVHDARASAPYSEIPAVRDGLVGAYAGVPLVDDGFILGTVCMVHREPRQFTDDDLEVLRHQAQLASSVLALRRSARTDSLTGLPNRGLLLDRLARAVVRLERHPGIAAVLFLDVDGFKQLNDASGHETGDWVLVELADRLTTAMRPMDTLARFGGDEFVAVCEGLGSASDAEVICMRVVEMVERAWVHGGERLAVSVSIGLVLVDSADADPAAVLREADEAMYEAKRRPGSGWVRGPR